MGVLRSLISFPFCGGHVPGRYWQCPTTSLVNEEYDEIPSLVSLPHCGVDVLPFPMASLDEPKLRLSFEDLNHLRFVDLVLSK